MTQDRLNVNRYAGLGSTFNLSSKLLDVVVTMVTRGIFCDVFRGIFRKNDRKETPQVLVALHQVRGGP